MQYSSSEYLAEILPAILQMSSHPPTPKPIVIQVLVRDELTNRYAYALIEMNSKYCMDWLTTSISP